jgi:hypothetical protein
VLIKHRPELPARPQSSGNSAACRSGYADCDEFIFFSIAA